MTAGAVLWLAAAAIASASCSDSDSLGGEPVTEVQVGSPPLWDNGIGQLMQLKCGVCHQVPAGPVSPIGIPQTFDLNFHMVSPTGVPGANDTILVLGQIDLGLLRGPIATARQMPLDYATPLTNQELTALEAWSLGGGL